MPTLSSPSALVLAESRPLRFTVFTLFYIVQGLPVGLISIALPAWMIAQDVGAEKVAFLTGIAFLPWGLKLFVGPILDRFSYPAMGSRRPWIIGTQFLAAMGALGLLGITDVEQQILPLTIVCTLVNACCATQDVAVDGLAVTLLKAEELGKANALMAAGQVTGAAVMGSVSTKVLNWSGIPAAGLLLAICTFLIFSITLATRERRGEKLLPWTSGSANPDTPKTERRFLKLIVDLLKAVLLPTSLILIFVEVAYRMTAGIAVVWIPQVAIQDLGYSDTQWADIYGTTGIVAAVLGIFGGPIIDKLGPKRSLGTFMALCALSYGTLPFLISRLDNPIAGSSWLMLIQMFTQFTVISIFVIFMEACHPKIAATQFALYMALANFARSGGIGLYPFLKDNFSLTGIAATAVLFIVASLVALNFVDLQSYRKRISRFLGSDPKAEPTAGLAIPENQSQSERSV